MSPTSKRPHPPASPERRLFSRLKQVGECHEWTGAVNATTGYGRLFIAGRPVGAHRYAYLLAHGGPIAEGYVVHHRCGNRRCCRPEHLELLLRGAHTRHHIRGTRRQVCRNGLHRLTAANRTARGNCLICARARSQEREKRKSEELTASGMRQKSYTPRAKRHLPKGVTLSISTLSGRDRTDRAKAQYARRKAQGVVEAP